MKARFRTMSGTGFFLRWLRHVGINDVEAVRLIDGLVFNLMQAGRKQQQFNQTGLPIMPEQNGVGDTKTRSRDTAR
jgi:hypothetical protein